MKTLLSMLLLLASFGAIAQQKDPVAWAYEVKQTAPRQYDIIFRATLQPDWHVWSMNAGGDGTLIPTTFSIKKNPGIVKTGAMSERGRKISKTMEGIDGVVNYYEGSVEFVQSVKLARSGKVTVAGEHEYQLCSSEACLPPRTKQFFVTLGQ